MLQTPSLTLTSSLTKATTLFNASCTTRSSGPASGEHTCQQLLCLHCLWRRCAGLPSQALVYSPISTSQAPTARHRLVCAVTHRGFVTNCSCSMWQLCLRNAWTDKHTNTCSHNTDSSTWGAPHPPTNTAPHRRAGGHQATNVTLPHT